jgi:hypothetical protein
MPNNIPVISVDEDKASILTDIPVSSLQKMRGRGDGPPFVKIGSRVRYRVADLEQFVADRVVSSTSAVA